MRVLTLTNLYPRPDEPQRGMYNAQQFQALAELLGERSHGAGGRGQGAGGGMQTEGDWESGLQRPASSVQLQNLCLVPEWRVWRWPAIRRWKDPFQNRFDTRYVPAFYVPVIGRNSMWWTYMAALESQSDCFAACSAVLATWLYPDGVAAEALGRRLGKPVWLKVHGTDRFHLEARGRGARVLAACRRAAGVVCVSRPLAEYVRAAGVEGGRVHIVPNGVDTDLFRWRARDEALAGLADARTLRNQRLVLFVGTLARIKGPDVMLDAWKILRATGAEHLVVIGDGPLRGDLERQVDREGLATSVTFLGSRPHRDVALWMNVADCLCLTSRSEGMPNVILEALASGLPVVATDVGACREMLEGSAVARVTPPAAPAPIATAIGEVLAAPADRQAMAARSGSGRSWRASAEALLELMR